MFGASGTLARPWHGKYLAMYSSVYGGIVTDPSIMMVPVDDHLVHRGDGVFDVAKCVSGGIYQFEGHLDRLLRSADSVSITPPFDRDAIRQITIDTVRAGGVPDCTVRMTLSRGPGGFSVKPSECPRNELYVNVIRTSTVPNEYLVNGVRAVISKVPIKPSYFARVKSCNYLPNVLMALEAEQAGAHFSVTLDERGNLAECSTENIIVLSEENELLFPEFDRILRGLTVSRVSELAEILVKEGRVRNVRFGDVSPQLAYSAREVMILGTTIDLLPVVLLDGRTVSDGVPGPVCAELRKLVRDDMLNNEAVITRVF